LAVGYGKVDHASWCEHQSIISIWNIFRSDHDPKKPTVTIEVSNCLTSLRFHPTNPLILAGGTMNGEIFLWDVNESNNNPVLQKSEPDEYFHRESINAVEWLAIDNDQGATNTYDKYLISISSDGKVLIWENPLRSLKHPIKGHMLVQSNPETRRTIGDLEAYQYLGGTAISYIKGAYDFNTESAFIIGTAGGQVQRVLIKNPSHTNDIREIFTGSMTVQWSKAAYLVLANIHTSNDDVKNR